MENNKVDKETYEYFKKVVNQIKEKDPAEISVVKYEHIEKFLKEEGNPIIDSLLKEMSQEVMAGIWEATVQHYRRVSEDRLYAVKYLDTVEFFTVEMFKMIISHFLNTLKLIGENRESGTPERISAIIEAYKDTPIPPGASKI